MSKYRIHELAKEFSLGSKEVIKILNDNKIEVKSSLNIVGDKERDILKNHLSPKKEEKIIKETKVNQGNKQKEHKYFPKKNEHKNINNVNDSKEHNKNNKGFQNRQNSNHNKNAGFNQNKNNNQQKINKPNVNNNNKFNNAHNQNNQKQNDFKKNNNKNHKVRNVNFVYEDNKENNRNDRRNKNEKYNKNNRNNNQNNYNQNNRFDKKNKNKNQKANQEVKVQEIIRPKMIKIGESITVKELASKMTFPVTDVIKKLMLLGTMATINQELDFETAALIAAEFNIAVEELPPEVDLTEIPEAKDDEKDLTHRPPVVTVMGHVDHGKTSLLDAIRKTSVTVSEAGGITQHIGAYQVNCKGQKIVFLDTPGHEAFTAMRARGAQVTDIAVLVVAADDGVMPQTIEAINHAKAAKVPIVVAVNKMDKPGANPDHVKQQLAEHGLISEEWGGDTIMVPVSAKKKEGIGDLLEMLLLVAEVQELKANPNREARGVIIEARLDKGRGSVASVLVQNGTLHIGDFIIAGTCCGKVRAMVNDRGEKVKKAGPSTPVEVLGLADVPEAGDELAVLEEKLAKTIAEKRIEKQRSELIKAKKVSLDDLFNQISDGDVKELNILVKADVQGSVEAVSSSLLGLNKNESEVRVNIIHAGVGAVTESDVMLASAANALVIAFNVRPDANARKVADSEKIDIHAYRVIYEAIDDIQAAMKGMLSPKYKEVIIGKVEIRQVMKFSKALVAGSYVLEGKVKNNSKIRIIRDNIVVYDGQIESLRRFKDDVKEVAAGYECGITIDNYRDFKEGDILEVYEMEEIQEK